MDEEKRRAAFFKAHINRWNRLISIAAASAYVGSAVFVAFHRQTTNANETVQNHYSLAFILLWVIGPPLFFLLEYSLVGRREDKNLPDIEAFKYTQDLCSKLWLAAVGILIFLYAGKIPGG
jgi:hypothetical protein